MGFFRDKRTGDPKWTAGDEEHDAALAESGVSVEAASRIRAMPTRWLVQDVVPDEAVTIIGGAAGAGKSFFACQLAADVARQLRGRVVFATAGYERPELLRWRLDQADGDARRIAIATLTPPRGVFDQRRKPREDEIDERMSILYYTIEGAADPESGILPQEGSGTQRVPGVQGSEEGKAEGKRQKAEEPDNRKSKIENPKSPVRLLVIDDVDGWFGTPGNMLSAAALARVIQRLNELAVEKRVAIVVLARVQLSVEGRITARQLSRIAHAASVVWMVARDREGARERGSEGGTDGGRDAETKRHGDTESKNPKLRRWLLPVKNNLAEDGAMPGLAFELVEGRIRWKTEPVPELAEVLLPNAHNNDRRRLRRAACEWLEEALAEGPMPSGEVIKQALSCGISRGTLQRAITDLGIKSHKSGFNGGWEMRWTPAVEPRRPVVWSGLRVVGAGDETCGQGDKETRGQGEGATERGGQTRRQGDTETRGQGEAGETLNSSCASSENCGNRLMASCASSDVVARSPDLATGATKELPVATAVEGNFESDRCQGEETLTKPALIEQNSSCTSSKKPGNCLMASCASSEPEDPKSNPIAPGENARSAERRSATKESGDESHALQEEETPHWMEGWCDQIVEALRKAC